MGGKHASCHSLGQGIEGEQPYGGLLITSGLCMATSLVAIVVHIHCVSATVLEKGREEDSEQHGSSPPSWVDRCSGVPFAWQDL